MTTTAVKIRWEKTKAQLIQEGYLFNHEKICGGATCNATLLFYWTPKGANSKLLPLSWQITPDGPRLVPHWAVCPDAKTFRKK